MKKYIAIATLCFTANSFATPITLSANIYMPGNNSTQIPGSLMFTYEDSTPDIEPNVSHGRYLNSLSNLTLSYGDTIWTLLPGADNWLGTAANGYGYVALSLDTMIANNFGETKRLTLGTEIFPVRTDDSLTNLAAQITPYQILESYLFFRTNNGPIETSGAIRGSFTQVPEPGTLGLLAIGAVGLSLVRRRGVKLEPL